MSDISIIILTHNEEKHLKRCIESIKPFASNIFIVDSFSEDKTLDIADSLKIKVVQNKWINYAKQFNWALDNLPIKTKWVMRMDCDEIVTKELASEINLKLNAIDKEITGIILNRRVYFMGHWIKYGGYYPTNLLRIWQIDKGRCEERWMDEHIKLSDGKTILFENDIIDDNLNNLTWWTEKHNGYATREAVDLLNIKYRFLEGESINAELTDQQDKRKRWLKQKLYIKIPFFARPFFYFIYRYLFKFGFLDGKPGLIWHFLQGFWYRFLVDAKIYDIERRAKKENKSIPEVLRDHYGIHL